MSPETPSEAGCWKSTAAYALMHANMLDAIQNYKLAHTGVETNKLKGVPGSAVCTIFLTI